MKTGLWAWDPRGSVLTVGPAGGMAVEESGAYGGAVGLILLNLGVNRL